VPKVDVAHAITIDDDVRALVAELEETLSKEYPPEQRHGLSLDALFEPHVRFFVARIDDAVVGCGGVALFRDFAEVKRVFVREGVRGRGAADAVLARIEEETAAAGLDVLRLETGTRQLAALRFYERAGFRRRDAFGAYAAMPAASIAESLFYEKRLVARRVDDARRHRVRSAYDDLAAPYARNLSDELAGKPLDREWLERFADRTRGKGRVCDLGCGPGHVARFLHDRGVDVFGVDLSPAMVTEARRLHPSIAFREGDMMALEEPEGSLAGIVAFYAIVHLVEPALRTAFREMRRVLRSDGLLLLAFHVGDDVMRPRELWGVPVALDWVFHRLEDVTHALVDAGLAIDDVVERAPYEGVEHPSRRAYVLARRVPDTNAR
jgi:SAM-dependent methyltransferase/GNAT superfamily N-acetyltransferase